MNRTYEISVTVYIRDTSTTWGALQLNETQQVELSTISDAAKILVKLHEFFEELRKDGVQ